MTMNGTKGVVTAGLVTYAFGLAPILAKFEQGDSGFQTQVPHSAAEKAEADRLHPIASWASTGSSTEDGVSVWSITLLPDHTEYTPGAASRAITVDLNFVATRRFEFPPNTLR
jgi:hypothetical protein